MATRLHKTDVPLKLINSLDNYGVTFLTAPTASGKSVLLIDILSSHPQRAIMIIPNRLSVKALHEYTASLYHNRKIGYRISGESVSSNFDDVTLVTTGYFMEYISYNQKILNYPLTLVIDEVHVPDRDTDLIIRVALRHRRFNKNLKVILSSATLDIKRFIGSEENKDIDIISGPYKEPNVKMLFEESSINDIDDIIIKYVGKDILVMCSGEQEIYNVMETLENSTHRYIKDAKIKCIYSKMDQEEFDFKKVKGDWVIYIATNIIESSITIPDLDVVIDCGERKIACTNSLGSTYLKTVPAAKSNIKQAIGRAGRGTVTGIGIVLMSKQRYDNLKDFPEHEVIISTIN